jgi:hypothetical protein
MLVYTTETQSKQTTELNGNEGIATHINILHHTQRAINQTKQHRKLLVIKLQSTLGSVTALSWKLS